VGEEFVRRKGPPQSCWLTGGGWVESRKRGGGDFADAPFLRNPSYPRLRVLPPQEKKKKTPASIRGVDGKKGLHQ